MVNEPSVFEPLKFYCIILMTVMKSTSTSFLKTVAGSCIAFIFFFIIFDSSEWAYTNVSDKDENFRTLILLQNQYNLKRKGTFATT